MFFCFKKLSVISSILLFLNSCASVQNSVQIPPEKLFSKFLRGTVYLENSEYKFRLCGSSAVTNLLDPKQKLFSYFSVNNEIIPSNYVEFDAIAIKDLDWQVERVFFVSQKPKKCGADIQSLDYSIVSKDGLWDATIRKNELVINQQNIYTKLVFLSDLKVKNQWRGTMLLPRGKSYTMHLKIIDKLCVDEFDQWYTLSAKLVLNGKKYVGCARKGDRSKSFVSGKYSNVLADSDAFIVLNLFENEQAELILDYRNGHPLLVNKGTWKVNSNNTLELELKSNAGFEEQNIMLFEVFNNHELRLKGFSELLGQRGLKLLPVQ
ncbi:MAG: hypothetical protein OFPII_34470 [Osedax symbiont Rs1]|nr:MAG: hypothetical protein OFPII_34470 [Osedax symbiont Rs1]